VYKEKALHYNFKCAMITTKEIHKYRLEKVKDTLAQMQGDK